MPLTATLPFAETDTDPSEHWIREGFAREMICISPPDARDPQGVPLKSAGKCPARRLPGGAWLPQVGWTRGGASEDDVREWAASGANLGLLTRNYPACDIDVLDASVAAAIQQFFLDQLGPGPIRRGNDPKLLILYAGAITKRILSFTLPNDLRGHKIEFLGAGQQCVVEGIHPVGKPYRWDGDQRPVAAQLTPIDQEAVDSALRELADCLVALYGATIAAAQAPGAKLTADEQAKLAEFSAQVADGAGVREFLADFDRPELRDDVEAVLASSPSAKGIRDGEAVHDNTVRFGSDAAANGLSKPEAVALCEVIMQDCPHPDFGARLADMPRCVGDGYDRQIRRLANRGAFGDTRFFRALSEVEDREGEDSEAALAFMKRSDDTPTDEERDAFFARRRAQRRAANDDGSRCADVAWAPPFRLILPPQFMQAVRPDILTNLSARDPIYGDHYWRGYVSATISMGGLGKSSLVLTEALAIATGRSLIGTIPDAPVPVFYFNGEDPRSEVDLRVAAIMQHYDIRPEELEGRFFYASGRDTPLLIAEQSRDGVAIIERTVSHLIAEARANDVGLMILDPLVSVHAVEENSNGAVDRLIKFGVARIAHEVGCGVEVIHHTRKSNGAPSTAEDGRGASALHAAARSVRTINRFTPKERGQYGIREEDAWKYLKVDHGKANMTPPKNAECYLLGSERLEVVLQRTGERLKQSVQVVERWFPQPLGHVTPMEIAAIAILLKERSDGTLWRANSQAEKWAGRVVEAVRMAAAPDPDTFVDCSNPALNGILEELVFREVLEKCDQSDGRGKVRPALAVCAAWEPDPLVEPGLARALADRAVAWQRAHYKDAW